MHSNCQASRPVFAKTLATLLAAQLATLAGCGSLGGPPSGAPWAQQAAPTVAIAPLPNVPTNNTPAPSRSTASQGPMNHAASAAASLATVVPVAYETPITEVAPGDTYYDSSASAEDDYYLTDEQIAPVAPLESLQNCPAGVHGAGCSCCAPIDNDNFREPYRNAQEYIFDGGDQLPAVVIKEDWSTAGVDPTDTVVYYETLAGSVCVRPTNRVPIYAPRFGAVRQVSGLQLTMRAQGTQRILAPVGVERFDENNLAGTVVQPLAPHGEQQVGLIDAFQENYVTPPMEQIQPLYRMSAARVPFELVDPTRTGLITIQELVDMQQFIRNAQTWVIPESLEVEISNQAALLVKDTQAAQEFVVYELPDKCAMRIFKAASHTIANSGDTVSFSIRFDNAGVKPLGNAVIIDSLSPRLSYIEGSQQCSVGVRFSAEPNQVGSMVLRWEIEEPIKPSDGGVISFDCRVR
ncbi:MAG: hypothetical protein KDA72_08705 [Planctomycetales bacterium]|nr:hypothetical protein [Planctomycetales bacterium]